MESSCSDMFCGVKLNFSVPESTWYGVSEVHSHLTWCRGSVQIHLLAVLPVAGLVAAPDPQHVHTVHLQPVDHGAGSAHFVQSLPAPPGCCQASPEPTSGCTSWDHAPAPVLHGEVPGWCRVLWEPPAEKELVVGQGALGVDHWSQRSWDKKK